VTSVPTRTEPTISVVMNCLNGEKVVKAAIESVYAQTFQDWEIVFLDNASTDATAAIAKAFDHRVRYFRNEQTVLLGRARNQALSKVSGEFVAFLDADDVWWPDKLERQLPLFDDPQTDFVFADTELRFADSGVRVSYFDYHRYRPPRGRILRDLLRHYAIPMLTTVIRTRALRVMPQWFDDEFRVCDDFDFFMRLAHRCRCDYVDEMLASCLLHEDAATVTLHRYAANEMRETLLKLERADPAFRQSYRAEADGFLRRVDYTEGKSFWMEGRRREAREAFLKHWPQPKFLASYAAAWLPFPWVKRLQRRWR